MDLRANGYVLFLSATVPILVGLEAKMAIVEVELPEKTAQELDALVEKGWFADRSEVIRLALIEFLGRNRLTLMEQFQEEDIRWAKQQKETDNQL